MYIEDSLYKQILENSVNLCVDVLLRYDHKYLLIKRKEEPCKGVYWPIGGRIHKGEGAEQAARRKIFEEIGIDFSAPIKPIGYYEDTYETNSFGYGPYSTLSICWLGYLSKTQYESIQLDKTSSKFRLHTHIPARFTIKTYDDYPKPYWYMESANEFTKN